MNFELLQKEQHIIRHLKKVLKTPELKDSPLMKEYASLGKQYQKLCREHLGIIKISDHQQKKLRETNLELYHAKKKYQEMAHKLSKYISYQVIEALFKESQFSDLGTKRKMLTVFFSDIVGFTGIAENIEPENTCKLLNSYFREMSLLAMKYGATIDKFIGDAILIFFGDPDSLGEKEDALACVNMALEMNRKLGELNKEWADQGYTREIRTRTGIATGYCAVGNFGCDLRLDYTVIGRYVNLANRIESCAEPGQILLAHETYALVKDQIHCLPQSPVSLKGIREPVQLYSVIGQYSELDNIVISQQAKGLSLDVNLNGINPGDKAHIVQVLKDTLTKLDGED